jgi:hypothetical protein
MTYSPPNGPLCFKLPDDTERMLVLDYTPHRWPGTGRYDSELSFSVRYPSKYEEERWPGVEARADAALFKYERLVYPHGRAHVEADCTIAFVPYAGTNQYQTFINGTELGAFVERAPALHGRMQRLGLGGQVCLAAAKICGGGLMPDGRRRAYMVAIDMRRFPGRGV